MRPLQVLSLILFLGVSAQSLQIVQLTLDQTSLVLTSADHYTILNTVDHGFLAVTRNGLEVIETQLDCSQVFKSIPTMTREDRLELNYLLTGIEHQFQHPIEVSSMPKYGLKSETNPDSSDEITGPWMIGNWGPALTVDAFQKENRMVEVVGGNITVTGQNLRPDRAVVKLIFIHDFLVEIYLNGKIRTTPLQCLTSQDDLEVKGLYEALRHLSSQREEFKSYGRAQKEEAEAARLQELTALVKQRDEYLMRAERIFKDQMNAVGRGADQLEFGLLTQRQILEQSYRRQEGSIKRDFLDAQNRVNQEFAQQVALIDEATDFGLFQLDDSE